VNLQKRDASAACLHAAHRELDLAGGGTSSDHDPLERRSRLAPAMAALSGFSSPGLLLFPRSPSAAAATLCRGASDRARAFHGAQSPERCGERAACDRRSGALARGARAHGAQRSALGYAAAASALPSAAGGDAGLLSSRRRESRDVNNANIPLSCSEP
jgi:hypothetical protein